MLWYIFVCSMIGGISVSVTSGLGAAIVTTAQGSNQVSQAFMCYEDLATKFFVQFNYWFIYFLIVFVAITLGTQSVTGNYSIN